MTPAQHKLACAMQANPTGRLSDWAKVIGCSTAGVSPLLRRMEASGYVSSVQINSNRKRFSLTTKVGCCPTCKTAQVQIEPTVNPRERKTNLALRRNIGLSLASDENLAKRFDLHPRTIARNRAKWKAEALAYIKSRGGE